MDGDTQRIPDASPMILLLGGTQETAGMAKALIQSGFQVIAATATEVPLELPDDPHLTRRSGMLDALSLAQLIEVNHVRAVVDVTHPYAEVIKKLADKVCRDRHLPYLRLFRPGVLSEERDVLWAKDHEEAAHLAFQFGQPVLLTTGSRNLRSYVRTAEEKGIPLYARVLSDPTSVRLCHEAGIDQDHLLLGRGPFSLEENRSAICEHDIGVLVAKDSGQAGGTREKLEACRTEGCRLVALQRPETSPGFASIQDLVNELKGMMSGRPDE